MFAAYLKNSVTKVVEPLRVMAWRVGACFVAMLNCRRICVVYECCEQSLGEVSVEDKFEVVRDLEARVGVMRVAHVIVTQRVEFES